MFGRGKEKRPLGKVGLAGEAGERAFNAAHVFVLELTDMVREVRRGDSGISTSIARTKDGFGVVTRYVPPKEEKTRA